MNEVETIRKLDAAARGRGQNDTQISDVTGWVLDDIRRAEPAIEERRVWQFAAAFGGIAAALAIAVVLQVYLSLDNPLSDIGLQACASVDNPFSASPLHLE